MMLVLKLRSVKGMGDRNRNRGRKGRGRGRGKRGRSIILSTKGIKG
jgi:hypothetical protein